MAIAGVAKRWRDKRRRRDMSHPMAWRSVLSEGGCPPFDLIGKISTGRRLRSQRATALRGNRPLPAFFGGGSKIVYLLSDQLKELGKLFEYDFCFRDRAPCRNGRLRSHLELAVQNRLLRVLRW
jgi:hypothetical protein